MEIAAAAEELVVVAVGSPSGVLEEVGTEPRAVYSDQDRALFVWVLPPSAFARADGSAITAAELAEVEIGLDDGTLPVNACQRCPDPDARPQRVRLGDACALPKDVESFGVVPGGARLDASIVEAARAQVYLRWPGRCDCVDSGGCLDEATPASCLVPCPSPTAPRAPEALVPAGAHMPAVLTPCPGGWRAERASAADPEHCEPGPAEPCPSGQLRPPGAVACRTIGAECPTGDWPENLPASRTIAYVSAAPGTPGDGARASPHRSVAQAIAATASPAVLALSKGTHRGAVHIGEAMELWGACAAETTIEADGGLSVTGGTAHVRSVTFTGAAEATVAGSGTVLELDGVALALSGRRQLRVDAGARVAGRDVRVYPAVNTGLYGLGQLALDGADIEVRSGAAIQVSGAGAALELRDAYIRGTGSNAVQVDQGASALIERTAIAGAFGTGIAASGRGTVVEASDVMLRRLAPTPGSGDSTTGLVASTEAHARVQRGYIDAPSFGGVRALGAGTQVTLEHVVVHDPQPSGGTTAGAGIEASTRAELRGDFVAVRGAHVAGVMVHGLGTGAQLANLDVRDTEASGEDGKFGFGLEVFEGAMATVTHAYFEGNRSTGVLVDTRGSELVLSDAVVRDTRPELASGTLGRGFAALNGATALMRRVRFEGNRTAGVGAYGAGTQVILQDVVVVDTRGASPTDGSGIGLVAGEGARVGGERVHLDRNVLAGMAAGAGSETILTDLVVEATRPRQRDGTGGAGIVAIGGSKLELQRLRVEDNVAGGVVVADAGTQVDLQDAYLLGTRAHQCSSGTCVDYYGAGDGIVAVRGGRVSMTRFVASENHHSGVTVEEGGAIDLLDGEIANNRVGAWLVEPDYESTRISRRVWFHDNEVGIQRGAAR